MKHNVTELYGVTEAYAKQWANRKYKEVLEEKIFLATTNIAVLVKGELTDETMGNIKLCQHSIEFNNALIQEIT